jgi:hypothetical protein
MSLSVSKTERHQGNGGPAARVVRLNVSNAAVAACMEKWQSVEAAASAARTQRTRDTLRLLLGPASKTGPVYQLPRVGICVSGGGWRAMSSAVAFFDGLSTALPAAETAARQDGVKLLDTVTHVAGLSGGSWMLAAMLLGGLRNPFHTAPGGAPNNSLGANPWLYGAQHSFVEAATPGEKYGGLFHMRDKTNIDNAAYRSDVGAALAQIVGQAFVEPTIPGVLLNSSMGTCFVQRWANFIANNILMFADNFIPPTEDPHESEEMRRSRQAKLSDLQDLVRHGDFPFVILSTIANRELQEEEQPGPTVRSFDWVEHTPFFTRNGPAQIVDCDDAACVLFPDKEDGDEMHTAPMTLHHLMAIAGSAFAFNLSIVAPKAVRALNKISDALVSIGDAIPFVGGGGDDDNERAVELAERVEQKATDPLLGGVTKVVIKHKTAVGATAPIDGSDEVFLGVLRDAGIDFNVPFPPLSPESGRDFDIIIAHDAGEKSENALELQRAVDLGYLKLAPDQPGLLEPFPAEERVRVFRGMPGYPTIIYFLGITDKPTTQIVQSAEDLESDLAEVRRRTVMYVQPLVLAELRRVASTPVPQDEKVKRAKTHPSKSTPAGGGDADSDGVPDGSERACCCSVQ